jgi:MFS family permease
MNHTPASRTVQVSFGGLIAALTVADVTASLESMMIFAALKTLITQYGDPLVVGWVVTAYLLVAGMSAAIASRLGDLFGRRRVLMVVLAITVLGSILSAASENLTWIIVGRAIQGVSGAIMPLGMGLLRQHVEPRRVALGVGILLSASGIGATAGLFIGGLLVDYVGWHNIFTVSAAFAFVSAVAVLVSVPHSRPQPANGLDIIGGVMFAPAIALIMLGVTDSSNASTTRNLLLLGSGILLLGVWFVHEYRHPAPLIDVRLLMDRSVLPNICTALWAIGALQLTQVQMIFLQQPVATGVGLGLTATTAALVKMPAKGITMFLSPLAGHLAGAWGPRAVVVIGFALGAIGWLLLFLAHGNIWVVGTIMALFCATGLTIVFTGLSTAIVLDAPSDRTSEAMGVMTVTRTVFQAVGAQIVMAVLGAGASGVYPTKSAYLTIFASITGVSILGVAAAWFLRPLEKAHAGEKVAPPLSQKVPT